jgi:hypothetical protein
MGFHGTLKMRRVLIKKLIGHPIHPFVQIQSGSTRHAPFVELLKVARIARRRPGQGRRMDERRFLTA